MIDPMELYREKARAVHPPDGLAEKTVESIRRLEEDEADGRFSDDTAYRGVRAHRGGKAFVVRPLGYAAIAAVLVVGALTLAPLLFETFPVATEATALTLESDRIDIPDPRTSVLEVEDEGIARIVLDVRMACSNTGDSPLAVSLGQGPVSIRVAGDDAWRQGIVLEGDGAKEAELSILVPVSEEDLESFRTGSPRAEAAYARVVSQAAQRLSCCVISLECDGFSKTEYDIEAEFDTDWQTVRRIINAGDRLSFRLVLR